MRILSKNRKLWLDNQVAKETKLLVKAAAHRHSQRLRGKSKIFNKTSIIQIPRLLVAERFENRKELHAAIWSGHQHLNKGPGSRVKFDFSKVEKVFPGGMLFLLAHLELLSELYPNRIRASCTPNSVCAQLFCHFGNSRLLGSTRTKVSHESVKNWHYRTGTHADGQKIASLLDHYRTITSVEPPENLYDVLAEALTNVKHHAYPAYSETPEMLKRWWLFSRFLEPTGTRDGSLFIAVYDLGVGIPDTMRRRLRAGELIHDKADELLKIFGSDAGGNLDRLLLQRAIEHPRSSTGLSHRGKGLPEMRDFVLTTKTGRLYIVSESPRLY
ncbi:MAG: hypothetical protein PGN26_14425 [Xylophilus ampelinus]